MKSNYEIEYSYLNLKKQSFIIKKPTVNQVIKNKQQEVVLGEFEIKSSFFNKIERIIVWPFKKIGKFFLNLNYFI